MESEFFAIKLEIGTQKEEIKEKFLERKEDIINSGEIEELFGEKFSNCKSLAIERE